MSFIDGGPQFAPFPSSAPRAPDPSGSNGPYSMGAPDWIVNISFPSSGLTGDEPWYWFFPEQQPQYFSYIASLGGWVRLPFFGVIKILAIDTQPLVPVPVVGFTSVEDAIDQGAQADAVWGRINLQEPFFWKVMGLEFPKCDFILGRPTPRVSKGKWGPDSLYEYLDGAVKGWQEAWNDEADQFNTISANVPKGGGDWGTYGDIVVRFALPLPPASFSAILAALGEFYLGPIPGGFNVNVSHLFKQAYSFTMGIQKLDPKVWDLSIYPPKRWPTTPGFIIPANKRKNYSGISPNVDFPLSGPQLTGL